MNNVGGVIVTHFPDGDFAQRLAAIARECAPVLVIDNSADLATTERLQVASAAHGAELVVNAKNRGLGAALNQGFDTLAQRGLTGAIAFDQDSMPAAGFSAALCALMAARPRCAVVGAAWTDEGRAGFAARHLRGHRPYPLLFERIPATQDLDDVTCVITSGSLFRLDVWRALGGFDEGLFLDYVDTDYCLRARARGGTIAVAARAHLSHRRGAKRPVHSLGRTFWPAFLAPLRLRYQWRNRLRLSARHGWRFPHWLLFESVYSAKTLAEILLLEDRKLPKLTACALGVWDGLIGRKGKIG